MKRLLITAAILSLLSSCSETAQKKMKEPFSVTITNSRSLADIPSASALEVVDGSLFFISDDAPAIFQTSLSGEFLARLAINNLPADSPRIPKPVKPDYEAAIATDIDGGHSIVAFGSGSLQPHRDTGLIMALAYPKRQQVVSLKVLYEALRSAAGIQMADFNIEGAALVGKELLLFNRGSNHVFVLDWMATLSHIRRQTPLPAVRAYAIQLPLLGGHQPRFSGATALDDGRLLFAASAEDTKDWYHDGEVMGSAIGILDVSGVAHIRVAALAPLKNTAGEIVKLKLEGLHLDGPVTGRDAKVLGVVDNDDGSSQLLKIQLKNIPETGQQ